MRKNAIFHLRYFDNATACIHCIPNSIEYAYAMSPGKWCLCGVWWQWEQAFVHRDSGDIRSHLCRIVLPLHSLSVYSSTGTWCPASVFCRSTSAWIQTGIYATSLWWLFYVLCFHLVWCRNRVIATAVLVLFAVKEKVNSWIYIALYYKPFFSKASRYGPCVTVGSHSFTCHPHTNHTFFSAMAG